MAEPTFLNLDATAWTAVTALATALLVLAGLVAGGIAFVQFRSSVNTWREERRPYVIAEFDASPVSRHFVDFVLRNVGLTPAFDVKIEWSERPVESKPVPSREFANARMFREPMAMLPPGREHRILFDSHIERNGRTDLTDAFTVTLRYKDRWKVPHVETYPLDVGAGRGTTFLEIKSVHDVAKGVDALAKTMNTTLSGGMLRVLTEEATVVERRNLKRWEAWARSHGQPVSRRAKAKRR